MGWRDVRKSVKKWRMNVGGRDESPSTPTLTQPSDSEQGDVQLSTEASGDTPQAQASTRPVADAQAIPSSMVADAIVTRPPATAPVEPRAEAPPATESPEQQTHALSTSQRLWNAAYDLLEDDKDTAQLVTAYVKTLVKVLGAEPETTGADITTELEDPLRRQLFMKKLVEEGQSKINKASKITRRVGEFAKAVLSLKPLVDMAVSIPYAAPAALPWAGVCAGLHILSNPAEAAKSNLAGITHVLSRMEWYDAVAEHLLNKDGIELSDWNFQAVLPQLEEKVVALFKALLLYQMKSVCSYYRHQGYVFLRGLAFQDDWGADLKIVTDAEETLKRDSDQYSSLHTTTTMGQLVERAKGIEGSLGDIHQTLQDFITQQKAIRRDNMEAACRRDLRVVDPQHDMERIERNKDELVDGAYKWILGTDEYASFINWYDGGPDSSRCRLLWINGHAGTGKTMLMIGIIRELSRKSAILAPKLSFFFCQGTDATLNNATAILRSLIWLLIIQQPCLCSHLLPRYEESGADLFKDRNAFYALSEVFRNMLEDPDLSPVYFAVDALDECEHGLADLIKLISTSMALSDKVKWIVSSRPTVELKTPGTAGSLVELDAQRLEEPVNAYIMHKLSALATRDGYDDGVLAKVADEVRGRAQNTFLWVALVFNELDAEDENHNPVHGEYALEIIGEIPPGLSKIYNHIMTRIEKGIRRDPEYCKNALVAAVLAYRPLTLSELAALAGSPPNMLPQTVARKCGSFLTVREETVYLIHQSAKDYLEENFESTLQPAGFAQGHANIGRRCIEAMSSILRRNIYNLDYGFKPKDMNPRHPDLLAPVRYACVFWADHLCFQNGGAPECRKALADDEVRAYRS
ncbi:Vegetative incompatibility protein HET-E-1 [Tolypocladium ophioglossoides CBS 100239]|uniref:Vegetative incompatibility protein HET-E-1 n=1 Tax=Tolypocladium ophioglossoides (strain CBS 100239) TaxID=1163406 RepID=A0A0L0MZQ3_TOLOC|nr:Vegetative incompatibility protein HET-E-1 [Tolypocladium ophioglossoides CBS 100239]